MPANYYTKVKGLTASSVPLCLRIVGGGGDFSPLLLLPSVFSPLSPSAWKVWEGEVTSPSCSHSPPSCWLSVYSLIWGWLYGHAAMATLPYGVLQSWTFSFNLNVSLLIEFTWSFFYHITCTQYPRGAAASVSCCLQAKEKGKSWAMVLSPLEIAFYCNLRGITQTTSKGAEIIFSYASTVQRSP